MHKFEVSNFMSRVSNSEFLMKFRFRLEILNRSPSRSRSLWSRLHHCYVATTAWKYSCEFRPAHFRSVLAEPLASIHGTPVKKYCFVRLLSEGIFVRVEFANPRWSSCSLMAVVRVSRTFNLLQIYVIYIFIYLTTTSGRPESECTLRRVMSSEPIQDEQLTRDANRRQTINKRLQARVDTLTADVPPWTKNSSSAILSTRDSDENMLP